jgi:hypothetical protein
MGGLHKTVKKVMPKEMRTPLDKKIGDENISTHESLSRRMDPTKALENQPEEPVIPLPDEEEIRRGKRRGTAARGGGRASTILSGGDQDRLGS